ncbi:uncharacterized protein METZ01_LOCUS407378, partial [marine metagenome]
MALMPTRLVEQVPTDSNPHDRGSKHDAQCCRSGKHRQVLPPLARHGATNLLRALIRDYRKDDFVKTNRRLEANETVGPVRVRNSTCHVLETLFVGIVVWDVLKVAFRLDKVDDPLCKVNHRYLIRTTEVENLSKSIRVLRKSNKAAYHVTDVTEATSLGAITKDCDGLVPEGLTDEA